MDKIKDVKAVQIRVRDFIYFEHKGVAFIGVVVTNIGGITLEMREEPLPNMLKILGCVEYFAFAPYGEPENCLYSSQTHTTGELPPSAGAAILAAILRWVWGYRETV